MNDYATTRAGEARRLTTAAALVCGLALLAALVPAIEHAANLIVSTAVGLALAVLAVRRLARWARERREDRTDAITAARWRAQHAPHLLDGTDRTHLAAAYLLARPGPAAVVKEAA
jgi:hypothetical protein